MNWDNDFPLFAAVILMGQEEETAIELTCAHCGTTFEHRGDGGDYDLLCDKCSDEQYQQDWFYGKYGNEG